MYGHKEGAQILLENGARDDMLSAAARGDLEAMEELISPSGHASSAIDVVNTPNRGGETPLMWATNLGHVEAMKLLFQHKAKADHRDQHGFTALMGASQHGHLGAIRLLVKERADINATEPEDGETPLMMAMHCARSDAVALLLELGAEKPPDFNESEAEAH
jgi:ankyrin repeat protein